jgi:hypothetical protein
MRELGPESAKLTDFEDIYRRRNEQHELENSQKSNIL